MVYRKTNAAPHAVLHANRGIAIMRTVLLAVGFAACVATAASAGTLDSVRQKGFVTCGSNTGLAGFGLPDDQGNWTGLDVDFCRAVASAIFNDAGKVKFVPLTAKDRFTALQSGEVDVLARNGTWTQSREAELGLLFGGVNYYDGQGFMVRKKNNIASALELNGASVCVQQGTTTELNLADYFRSNNMKYEGIAFATADEAIKAYDSGRCDSFTTDVSQLYGERLKLVNPDEHVVLPEVISKEPLAPAVRQGDDQWFNIIRWTHYAMLNAEELGVMRLSSNWVLRKFATIYVETLRNVPLLLQLLFWYNAILSPLPGPRASLALPGLSLGWPGVPVLCVALVAGVAAVVLSRLGKRAQPASALAVTAPICVPLLAFISLAVLLGGFGLVGGIADAGLLRWGAPAGVYLNNRGLFMPEAHLEPGATGVGVALVFAVLAAIAYGVWARRRQAQTGAQSPTVLVGLGLVIMLPLLAFFALGRPIALDYPVLRGFNFQGGLRVLPEFVALVLGLVLYTATFIGEIVRAGIQSVARGQSEAAHALGLRPGATLRLVVIPQAMRVIVPPLTNQYLNLTKNSSLAVFVGYPDLVQVFAGTVLNQTGAAVQVIAITMAVYLVISLATSWLMDLYNRRMALQER